MTIKVKLVDSTSKTFKVSTSNLNIENIGEGLKATFDKESLNVTVSGPTSKLNGLKAADITGYVDASGLSEGNHSVSVKLNLDGDLTAESATTKITITSTEE